MRTARKRCNRTDEGRDGAPAATSRRDDTVESAGPVHRQAAGRSMGTSEGTTSYGRSVDVGTLSERYGLDVDRYQQARRIHRLESDFGDHRVQRWVDEGMPVDVMGKPQDMRAFRHRQARRPVEVPTDVERTNRASRDRNANADRETGPAGDVSAPEAVRNVVSSPGRSMNESVQREMEAKMGGDFSDVQLHTGPDAATAAESIDARAFTVGNHVAFNRGEYEPDSDSGKEVLAHELTHVRQQVGGRISMLPKSESEHPGQGLSVGSDIHLQPKLTVSSPDDPAEKEADRVAESVVDGNDEPSNTPPVESPGGRARDEGETEAEPAESVHPAGDIGGEVSGEYESMVRGGVQGNSKRLPAHARANFEPKMGSDFSDVQVHTGVNAHEAAHSINAEAYSMDSNIAFRDGAYNPETKSGTKLLAHELTHVAQQKRGTRTVHRKVEGLQREVEREPPEFDEYTIVNLENGTETETSDWIVPENADLPEDSRVFDSQDDPRGERRLRVPGLAHVDPYFEHPGVTPGLLQSFMEINMDDKYFLFGGDDWGEYPDKKVKENYWEADEYPVWRNESDGPDQFVVYLPDDERFPAGPRSYLSFDLLEEYLQETKYSLVDTADTSEDDRQPESETQPTEFEDLSTIIESGDDSLEEEDFEAESAGWSIPEPDAYARKDIGDRLSGLLGDGTDRSSGASWGGPGLTSRKLVTGSPIFVVQGWPPMVEVGYKCELFPGDFNIVGRTQIQLGNTPFVAGIRVYVTGGLEGKFVSRGRLIPDSPTDLYPATMEADTALELKVAGGAGMDVDAGVGLANVMSVGVYGQPEGVAELAGTLETELSIDTDADGAVSGLTIAPATYEIGPNLVFSGNFGVLVSIANWEWAEGLEVMKWTALDETTILDGELGTPLTLENEDLAFLGDVDDGPPVDFGITGDEFEELGIANALEVVDDYIGWLVDVEDIVAREIIKAHHESGTLGELDTEYRGQLLDMLTGDSGWTAHSDMQHATMIRGVLDSAPGDDSPKYALVHAFALENNRPPKTGNELYDWVKDGLDLHSRAVPHVMSRIQSTMWNTSTPEEWLPDGFRNPSEPESDPDPMYHKYIDMYICREIAGMESHELEGLPYDVRARYLSMITTQSYADPKQAFFTELISTTENPLDAQYVLVDAYTRAEGEPPLSSAAIASWVLGRVHAPHFRDHIHDSLGEHWGEILPTPFRNPAMTHGSGLSGHPVYDKYIDWYRRKIGTSGYNPH